MKKFNILILILLILATMFTSIAFAATDIPTPTNNFYVNDYANVLSDSTEQLIMQNSIGLQEKTGAQIVVVTVNSLEGNILEDYSLNILRSWGIGDEKADNGVLLLISINDRMSRIEVGYGLEGCLPDGKTGRIQDEYMIPYFKLDNYDEGIKNGYLAILQEVAIEYSLDMNSIEQPVPQVSSSNQEDTLSPLAKVILGIFIVIILIIDWTLFGGRITRTLLMIAILRGGRGGSSGGGGFRGGGGSGGGGGSSRSW